MKYQCDKCNKFVNGVYLSTYINGEKMLVCQECKDHEEARGDYEYERQKEERGNV